jgi:lipid A disaccharide synthetase
VSLPNLLAGRGVVPEHLQQLHPAAITADLLALRGAAGRAQVEALAAPIASLEGDRAVARIVERLAANRRG